MQRFFDIILSVIAIIVLSPLLIVISVMLRLTGEGEVFYRQPRIGRYGQTFGILKFATMRKNSPAMGTGTYTVKNDPRVLPIGRFLRKSKINEMPQIFNILKGDMSLVGPRPHTKACYQSYDPQVYKDVTSVRPGLTGLGSVVFRDEEKVFEKDDDDSSFYYDVLMPYKGRIDQFYVHNQSLWLYFKLTSITVWVIFFPNSRVAWKQFRDIPKPPEELIRRLLQE